MQALAREHRRELGLPILAITGSNGKTTTKELVSRVLAEKYEVYATRGNLNNHIGVPLTLLAMTRDVEFGIVEMGASACGEIALLCSIAEPNYGIVTNIGRATWKASAARRVSGAGKASCTTGSPGPEGAFSFLPTTRS